MPDWIPSRAAALARLSAFVPRAGRDYERRRNFDHGPDAEPSVSGLSPWLSHRLITEVEVIDAVLDVHSAKAAEKFIQEVCWRTYWKGWLQMRPSVWSGYRAEVGELIAVHEGDAGYQAAVRGETGIECFDDWVRELRATGYLHNHARMWFASIWVFTLRLPWQLGADLFLRHLLDGDPASNTLSWRWVAGLQTSGKHYLARPDNIARFTDGRYPDPVGLATDVPPPEPVARVEALPLELPRERLETGRVGWLLGDHDLTLDGLAGKPVVAAGLVTASDRSPGSVSHAVEHFSSAAVEDALASAGRRHANLEQPPRVLDSPEAVSEWAADARLSTVVCAFAPVGWASEAQEGVRAHLADRGVRLVRPVRAWDRRAWPHARRGFFPFNRHIPTLLAARHAIDDTA